MTVLSVLGLSIARSADYCTEYSSPTSCNSCIASFRSPRGECIRPTRALSSCMMYGEDGACLMCVFGYKLKSGFCSRVDRTQGCVLFNSNEKCLMCAKGGSLRNGECVNTGCSDSKCFSCSNNGKETCLRCSTGFVLKKDPINKTSTCIQTTTKLSNCWTTFDGINCYACDVNYFLYAGRCLQTTAYYFDLDWFHQSNRLN